MLKVLGKEFEKDTESGNTMSSLEFSPQKNSKRLQSTARRVVSQTIQIELVFANEIPHATHC